MMMEGQTRNNRGRHLPCDMTVDLATVRQRLQAHGTEVKAAATHHDELKRASVMVLLANDGNILLTQRTLQLKSHPGEVCFPGGKQDEEDKKDDWVTAFRETNEEVGLDVANAMPLQPLCRLRTMESLNHLCVTPLVAFIDQSSEELSDQLKINHSEVEMAFWTPLEYFATAKPTEEYEIPWAGEIFVYRKYMFTIPGSEPKMEIPITGLTAGVAYSVAEIAFGKETCGNNPGLDCRGMLWRLHDGESKPYWSRKHFVVNHGMLHQYDSWQVADRKSQSATKKNRLPLSADMDMEDLDDAYPSKDENKARFAFRVSTLEGRVSWHLAASSKQERTHWKELLMKRKK